MGTKGQHATSRPPQPLDYAVTRLDLICHCLKATVSSETIITVTDFFNIIHLPYNERTHVNLFPTHSTSSYVREVTINVSVITFGYIQGVHFTQMSFTVKKGRSYLYKNVDIVLGNVCTGLSVYL